MRWSEKSQSLIEYTVVIILVTAAVFLMRPYVIRAINAHFRGWEDAVTDSMRENIKGTNAEGLSAPLCCSCETCTDCHCPLDRCLCEGCPAPHPCSGCKENGYCGDGYCCDASKGGTETPACPDCPPESPCNYNTICEPLRGEDESNCKDCWSFNPCDGYRVCDTPEGLHNCPIKCCPIPSVGGEGVCGDGICNSLHCPEPSPECGGDCCLDGCGDKICQSWPPCNEGSPENPCPGDCDPCAKVNCHNFGRGEECCNQSACCCWSQRHAWTNPPWCLNLSDHPDACQCPP